MSEWDERLDRLLDELRRRIGDLEGFEKQVGETLRRHARTPDTHHESLESIVSRSLGNAQEMEGIRSRRLRPGRVVWISSLAASILVAFTLFFWYRSEDKVLASIEQGSGEFEIRHPGDGHWRKPAVPLKLGPGDEVRAVASHPVQMRIRNGGRFYLHPSSHCLLGDRTETAQGARVDARLLNGVMDVNSLDDGGLIILVKAGGSECKVVKASIQVSRSSNRGTVYAAYHGLASVKMAGFLHPISAGNGLFLAERRGSSARVTAFRLGNEALKDLISDIRSRWEFYVNRETRRKRAGGMSWTIHLYPGVRKLIRLPGSKGRVQVPFPPRGAIQERARRFLAAHTEDDRRFVTDSLKHALLSGLPEIAGMASRCLTLMGEDSGSIEKRIESVIDTDGSRLEGRDFAHMAALAEAGSSHSLEVVKAGLSCGKPLRTRALAVLAVAGLQDTGLLGDVHLLALGSAGELYHDWQASTDFCDAVGLAFARARGRKGVEVAGQLIRAPELSVKSRRRYLSGFARGLCSRPAEFRRFLLDSFSLLPEAKMKRAVVMELLKAVPIVPAASVTAFFRDLADERGPLAPLAMSGMVLYAPPQDIEEVENYLLDLLENDSEAWVRSAAAQAFSAREKQDSRLLQFNSRVLGALEKALGDRDPEVRTWVARSLGVVGLQTSLGPMLKVAGKESDHRCLVAMAHALVSMPGAGRHPGVIDLLESQLARNHPHFVRNALIACLGRLGTDVARLILEDICTISENPEDRRAANAALVEIQRRTG